MSTSTKGRSMNQSRNNLFHKCFAYMHIFFSYVNNMELETASHVLTTKVLLWMMDRSLHVFLYTQCCFHSTTTYIARSSAKHFFLVSDTNVIDCWRVLVSSSLHHQSVVWSRSFFENVARMGEKGGKTGVPISSLPNSVMRPFRVHMSFSLTFRHWAAKLNDWIECND